MFLKIVLYRNSMGNFRHIYLEKLLSSLLYSKFQEILEAGKSVCVNVEA